MQVHLVDGTFELFASHMSKWRRPRLDPSGMEIGATRGVLLRILSLLEDGATHVGVATDHVIESFRNDMWPGYKTGEGVDPDLSGQFGLLEDALRAMGIVVWAMVDREADDALASAALVSADDPRVDRVVICTPDKDLAQVVQNGRIVQWDRVRDTWRDETGVIEKFGVPPVSIPDWLALVGDAADGFPGIPGFGAKTAATILRRWRRVEDIPADAADWDVTVRGAAKLATTLQDRRHEALLFKDLATLRADPAVIDTVDDLRWPGPTESFEHVCERLTEPGIAERTAALARSRA